MSARRIEPSKVCAVCGVVLERQRFGKRLEDYGVFLRRRHCSLSCANTREQVTLAGYRKRAVKFRKKHCETCGTTVGVHAHHKNEDVTDNRPENIATHCGSCHLKWHWSFGKRSETRRGPTGSGSSETEWSRRRPPRRSRSSGSTSKRVKVVDPKLK